MRFGKTFNIFIAVPLKTNLDLIFTIERKDMIDYRAPTCSERQTVHVVSLCPVRRQNHHTAPDRRRLTADRQFTDGARSRQITLHQRRRKTARVHVIEPKCRIVARQQRRGVDLERRIFPVVKICSGAGVDDCGEDEIESAYRDAISRRTNGGSPR